MRRRWFVFLLVLAVLPTHARVDASSSDWDLLMRGGDKCYHNGQLGKATVCFKKAFRIAKLNGQKYELAESASHLSSTYLLRNLPEDAESCCLECLGNIDKFEDPIPRNDVAILNNLGRAYLEQKKFDQAESVLLRVFSYEKTAGLTQSKDFPSTANSLAILYVQLEKFSAAADMYKLLISTSEASKTEIANYLRSLALVNLCEKKYFEAEPLFKRSIALLEEQHCQADLAKSLEGYAGLLRNTDRIAEAVELEKRASSLRFRELPDSPI